MLLKSCNILSSLSSHYEYFLSKIDPEILKYIIDNERLNVTVNGQSAAMTLKGNKVVVEFF